MQESHFFCVHQPMPASRCSHCTNASLVGTGYHFDQNNSLRAANMTAVNCNTDGSEANEHSGIRNLEKPLAEVSRPAPSPRVGDTYVGQEQHHIDPPYCRDLDFDVYFSEGSLTGSVGYPSKGLISTYTSSLGREAGDQGYPNHLTRSIINHDGMVVAQNLEGGMDRWLVTQQYLGVGTSEQCRTLSPVPRDCMDPSITSTPLSSRPAPLSARSETNTRPDGRWTHDEDDDEDDEDDDGEEDHLS